jgi:hypothetical protein
VKKLVFLFPRTLTGIAIAFALWSGVPLPAQQDVPLDVPPLHFAPPSGGLYPGGNSQPAEPAGGASTFPLYA